MSATPLSESHLADLHERAAELGVPRFRLLPRPELIEAIERAEGEGGAAAEAADAPDREERPRRRRRRSRSGERRAREREEAGSEERGAEGRDEAEEERDEEGEGRDEAGEERDEAEAPADEETEDVSGILDRMPQGYGFLRLGGLGAAEGDVYVSASQIRRCELRPGDEVSGPARPPRRGERHRALVRVAAVNGQEPEGERVQFEDLTAVPPHRRIPLGQSSEPLARAVDLLAPLAFGQRVLVLAQPRSGRTTLLRAIASALQGTGARVRVLLADERPEEVTKWEREAVGAEIVAAPADQEPHDQVRTAELAIGHAKRRAEAGEDIVVIVDSLSRLALGYRDPNRVKRLFGAGRELSEEGSGSLTIIATVLDSDERGEQVRAALETTENALIRLDADLASRGVFPSIDVAGTRASGEEELRSPAELEEVRELRAELSEMEPAEAARALAERTGS
ncbi:MAG: transcription termination factor Rho [Solirubrobacterales bacterium]